MTRISRNSHQLLIFLFFLAPLQAAAQVPLESIQNLSRSISEKVVTWRRDFHRHPELSNREFRTSGTAARNGSGGLCFVDQIHAAQSEKSKVVRTRQIFAFGGTRIDAALRITAFDGL